MTIVIGRKDKPFDQLAFSSALAYWNGNLRKEGMPQLSGRYFFSEGFEAPLDVGPCNMGSALRMVFFYGHTQELSERINNSSATSKAVAGFLEYLATRVEILEDPEFTLSSDKGKITHKFPYTVAATL